MWKRNKQIATTQGIPWMSRLLVSIFNFFLDACRRHDGTINRRLIMLFDVKCRPNPNPRCGISTYDVSVDPSRDLEARLYLPTAPPPSSNGYPVIVYFHGGGFILFSSSSKPFDEYCHRLAREISAVIVSVNYRLAPEHLFPAQYDDGLDILRFLDAQGETGGSKDVGLEHLFRISDLSNCFIAGDSAGGNITHHTSRRWCTEVSPGRRHLRLSGLILIQPFFGGQERVESEIFLSCASSLTLERTDWFWKAFLPEGADRDHHACNVLGSGSKATRSEEELGKEFPPVLVAIGTADPLMDRQKAYARGLGERGKEVKVVEFPSAIHGFYMLPEVPQSAVLIEKMKAFIDNQSITSDNDVATAII